MPCPEVKNCACTSTGCANHAKCCECVAHHAKNGGLPACLRPAVKK